VTFVSFSKQIFLLRIDVDEIPVLCLKETEARAYDLVRLALFAENNRTSLKRDEINKKGQ
jgi:hypothetical protein